MTRAEKAGSRRRLSRLDVLAEKALWRAVAGVIEEHRHSGRPLAIWRDEKVAWISAEEFYEGFAEGSLKRWGRIVKARKTALPLNWGIGEIAMREIQRQRAHAERRSAMAHATCWEEAQR